MLAVSGMARRSAGVSQSSVLRGLAFPEGTPVPVRYPLHDDQNDDRDSWPWLPGIVLAQCDPNEWRVVVEVPALPMPDPSMPNGDDRARRAIDERLFRRHSGAQSRNTRVRENCSQAESPANQISTIRNIRRSQVP